MVGLAVAAVGAIAVAATVKCISGVLDKKRLANLARQEGMKQALIDTIERCNNKVTLKDLNSNRTVTYQGQGIARDVREGIVI